MFRGFNPRARAFVVAAFALVTAISLLSVNSSFFGASAQTTFPGTGAGPIPDSASATCGTDGAPLNVTFNVSGMSSAPTNMSVGFTVSTAHSWIGDLTATLIAPNGTSATIFGYTGATTANGAGSSNNQVLGTYTYGNSASTNWWTAVAANVNVPAGNYRTSNRGGLGATNPMPNTDLDAQFAAIPSTNGTWTLRMTDGCNGDTGAISAASLTITSAAPADALNDVTGDGKTDFINVRADGPVTLNSFMGANDTNGKDKVGAMQRRAESLAPDATGVGWWVANNNQTPIARYDLGTDLDFFLTGDYDGDGKDDLTVWTSGAAGVAAFRILKSSTNTVSTRLYGQTGDDPTMGGDWNGDGKDDLAVYRDGTPGSPQSYFFWSDESTPTSVNYILWGTDSDFGFTLDYDGDGKSDAAIQRNNAGSGQFWIRQSSNGATVLFNYGLSADFIVPGDFDGDGRDDICVSRNADFGAGTRKYFWIRESDGGGFPDSPFQWGIPGDFITQGDFDGDRKTDLAVWRANADPTQNFFFVRRSSDGALQQFEWGQSGDYPVNNWNVH